MNDGNTPQIVQTVRSHIGIYCRESKGTLLPYPTHWHSYYEIELVLSSKGIHTINGREYAESRGDVFIMRLNDSHSFRREEEAFYLVVDVPPNCIPRSVEEMLLAVKGNVITHLEEDTFQKMLTLYHMLDATRGENNFDTLKRESICAALIMEILSHVEEDRSDWISPTNLRLREIMDYIHSHIQEKLTAKTIAEHFYVSKEYLYAFCRKNMGISLMNYVRKVRMEAAMELLLHTEKSVEQIAEVCGYPVSATFTRAFHKEYGIPPSEVRKKR